MATSFITQVLIWSGQADFEFFKLAIILATSSGLTGLKLKVQFLPCMDSLSFASGSVVGAGILCLSCLTFSRKKLFIAAASLAGLVSISPFTNNLVGGPAFPQLSHDFTLL